MGFKCGIVGLPNVGKSSLFNALTQSAIAAENYPFCTIDPNVGVVVVPDERAYVLQKIAKTNVVIPAAIEFVDIAGLVKGASAGEGGGGREGHGRGLFGLESSGGLAELARDVSAFNPFPAVHAPPPLPAAAGRAVPCGVRP